MSAQRSCFTIHGKKKESLMTLFDGPYLIKYKIDPESKEKVKKDLRLLGIDHSTIYPDLEGLSRELEERF